MNRVLDHIYADLTQRLDLTELATIADLSPFHFHRIFQAMVGETPNDFVKRLRLERAVGLMCVGKGKSITELAFSSGFASSSDFSRCFKLRYGVAPSRFNCAAWKTEQLAQKESTTTDSPFKLAKCGSRSNPDEFRVKLRELPARTVAYIRVSNPYHGDSVERAAGKLVAWAESHGVAEGQWLGYQYDSPEITAREQCFYCVAVEVQSTFKPEDEIGIFRFPATLIAEVELQGDIDREVRLLQWLYGSWLPRSRYLPADQPCFEAWRGKPFANGLQHFELSIQLPLKQV